MKLFKRTSQIPRVQPTAADVHLMLMAFSMAYMDEIVQSLDLKAQEKAERLKILGFENSAEVIGTALTESKYDEYKALCVYKETFPDSIFLKVDDFKKVLEKYGLVAGLVSQYTGTIPDDCLSSIEKALDAIDKNCDIPINKEYLIIYSFWPEREEYKNIYKNFPFIKGLMFGINAVEINRDTFLIAATPDKMKNPLDVVKSRIKADPIVFQLLPHDIVVVHAKWGDEANDEAFTNKIL